MSTSQNPTPSVAERNQEFVAVSGSRDNTSAEVLLVAAYGLMWAFVFALVFLTHRKQAALAARLNVLESGKKEAR
jgi:hypothetical protein